MAFAENLKYLREQKGISQAKLASLVGITQPTIAQYEIGLKVPTIIVGVRIAEQLGVTAEELTYGELKKNI
jgi:transcriptional regulator with XRE-family HTH domain